MLDLSFPTTTPALLQSLELLPAAPSPDLSDRYMFIDTRRVINDMRDLGFEVAAFRRPKYRTRAGAFSLHEVDFRRPEDMVPGKAEGPRVVFMNSYDGSRRAQIVSGIIRFICSNGLIAGDIMENQKFLHLGDYEEQLLEQIKASGDTAAKAFANIDRFKQIQVSDKAALELAKKARSLRYDEKVTLDVDPLTLIQPRRREDNRKDLWTRWNVLQENLLKGGIPGKDTSGNIRVTRPLAQIQKSNDLNRNLWTLLEEFAEAA